MILNVWKYLMGYVMVSVTGFAPERLLNLCANQKIYIWNLRRTSEAYFFCVSRKAFFMLRPLAKKTGCRVRIVKKKGLPFKTRQIRRNHFLLIALLISFILIITLSLFVWKIELCGNVRVSTEEIMEILNDGGVQVGTLKSRLNSKEIEDTLMLRLPEIMWVSCELKGTKMLIEIREGTIPLDLSKETRPCDLVATEDGIIQSIITRKGTPLVKAGDSVKKGQVLVSGTLEIRELTELKGVNFTTADADIQIETVVEYYDSESYLHLGKKVVEGSKTDHILQIFQNEINFLKPKLKRASYDEVITTKQAEPIKDFYLPIYIKKIQYIPYIEAEEVYTLEEAKEILQNRFNIYIHEMKENNIQILLNDVVFKEEKEQLIALGNLKLSKQAVERVFFDSVERRNEYDKYFTEEDGNTT